MKQENITQLRTPFGFFKYVVRPHTGWFILAILFVVSASILGSGSSYIFKLIIDAVQVGDQDKALFFGLLYPVIVFSIQVLYRGSGVTAGYLILNTIKTASDTLHAYVLDHGHTYYSNRFAGSVTNKIKNVTGALDQIIPDLLRNQLDMLVSFLVTFALIFSVDRYAAWLFIILIIVLGFANRKMAGKKAELSKNNAEANTLLQGRAVDTIGNISAMRQYARRTFEQIELEKATEHRKKTGLASWLYTEKLLFINTVIIFVFIALMFWILVTKWAVGVVSTSEFILVLALISQITGSLLFVGRAINTTARAVGELQEGLEDIYMEYEINDRPDAPALAVAAGEISWNQVSFQYEHNQVFKGLNLVIAGRSRIGLVGTSGAGKSTFVSLLLRQHEVMAGTIAIDGQDINTVTQESLRSMIAVVPQEPALFHRSIRDNIAYGNLEASDEDIKRVAKLAYAHDFITKLPLGYDTLVGERGVKLSGGQKQRIAIARAMIKDSPILILDEATSALDSESEHLIQKALHSLMVGKTVIAIAHRLSTLREMDRIIVIENGIIVEDGPPEVLKAGGGLYARLWSHQAGGFISE